MPWTVDFSEEREPRANLGQTVLLGLWTPFFECQKLFLHTKPSTKDVEPGTTFQSLKTGDWLLLGPRPVLEPGPAAYFPSGSHNPVTAAVGSYESGWYFLRAVFKALVGELSLYKKMGSQDVTILNGLLGPFSCEILDSPGSVRLKAAMAHGGFPTGKWFATNMSTT